MHGGKREGAGRKSYGPTKVYRLPIALEARIERLHDEYKREYERNNDILENYQLPKALEPEIKRMLEKYKRKANNSANPKRLRKKKR